MIGMIMGRTMIGRAMDESARVHRFHQIKEIIVRDCASLRGGMSLPRVVCAMIGMIMRWTMIGRVMIEVMRDHRAQPIIVFIQSNKSQFKTRRKEQ